MSKFNIEAHSKESYLVPLISKFGAIQFAVLSIDPGLIYLYSICVVQSSTRKLFTEVQHRLQLVMCMTVPISSNRKLHSSYGKKVLSNFLYTLLTFVSFFKTFSYCPWKLSQEEPYIIWGATKTQLYRSYVLSFLLWFCGIYRQSSIFWLLTKGKSLVI